MFKSKRRTTWFLLTYIWMMMALPALIAAQEAPPAEAAPAASSDLTAPQGEPSAPVAEEAAADAGQSEERRPGRHRQRNPRYHCQYPG